MMTDQEANEFVLMKLMDISQRLSTRDMSEIADARVNSTARIVVDAGDAILKASDLIFEVAARARRNLISVYKDQDATT